MRFLTRLKVFIPPVILPLFQRLLGRGFGGVNVEGDYSSWADAISNSTNYDSEDIFTHVREAALKVKRGEAVFERDSVCFYEEEYRWPTLACLLRIALEGSGHLNVLDFGGSLGSFYFQHRKFISPLKMQRWAVVEQLHYVECGQRELQNDTLKFYVTINDCCNEENVDVVFCSSTLQYLPNPYSTLDEMVAVGAQYILFDRLSIASLDKGRLAIQSAKFGCFQTKLPIWFFSMKRLCAELSRSGYELVIEFPCEDSANIPSFFVGLLFQRSSGVQS